MSARPSPHRFSRGLGCAVALVLLASALPACRSREKPPGLFLDDLDRALISCSMKILTRALAALDKEKGAAQQAAITSAQDAQRESDRMEEAAKSASRQKWSILPQSKISASALQGKSACRAVASVLPAPWAAQYQAICSEEESYLARAGCAGEARVQ